MICIQKTVYKSISHEKIYRAKLKKDSKSYVFVLGIAEAGNGVPVRHFMYDPDIIRYVITAPYRENEEITYDYVRDYVDEFDETYRSLEDDFSRKTFCSYLNLKISGDISYNFDVACKNQYFNDLTMDFRKGIFVDCGAFHGDTVESFAQWSGDCYEKIYALEADKENHVLTDFIRKKKYRDVDALNYGVWDKKGELSFSSGDEGTSEVSVRGEHQIIVDTLDNILDGQALSFIKMDIEGSELKALQGTQKIIYEHMPALAICVYHRANDLIDIPKFIKSCVSPQRHYRFFLRKHRISTDSELVLYAIPGNK